MTNEKRAPEPIDKVPGSAETSSAANDAQPAVPGEELADRIAARLSMSRDTAEKALGALRDLAIPLDESLLVLEKIADELAAGRLVNGATLAPRAIAPLLGLSEESVYAVFASLRDEVIPLGAKGLVLIGPGNAPRRPRCP